MKYYSVFLVFILSSSCVTAQDQEFKNSLGMDILPSLAVLFDGNINYLEFAYTRKFKKLDLRAKINFSKDNSLNGFILAEREILPEDNLFYRSGYRSRRSYLFSLGVTKSFKKGKLNYFFGLDMDAGSNLGSTTSLIFEEGNMEDFELVGFTENTYYSLGFTPVLGAKIPLMARVNLVLELGVPMFYEFGEISYFREDRSLVLYSIENKKVNFNRLLNDVRIAFSF